MPEPWSSIRARLAEVAMRRGIKQVALDLPAHRTTVYRILSGETQKPQLAVRQSIERILTRERQELRRDP